MVYSQYKQKLEKTVRVLNALWRFKYLILLGVIALVALVLSLCAMSGNIYSDSCPSSVEYGTSINLEAKAFLASTSAEYSADGTVWSEDEPAAVGTYYVRAKSRGVFGKKYGVGHKYEITARASTLTITDDKFEYGGDPEASASLVYSDEIAEVEYEYSYVGDNVYEVTATVVSIVSGDGRDVTNSYNIQPAVKKLTCVPREITISTAGAEKTYDGKAISADSYDITAGSLLEGHEISASFSEFTNAGTYENKPEITIRDAYGSDVTHNYSITYACGSISISQLEITINTGSAEKLYDGEALILKGYYLDGVLVSGHEISLTYPEIVNAGTYENKPEVTITYGGYDVTDNYSIKYNSGNLTVSARPITVYTASATWVYDGEKHSAATGYGVSANSEYTLLSGHALSPTAASVTANTITEITDSDTAVGYVNNALEFTVRDSGSNDVTANYEFAYEYGSLRVKTPVIISLYSRSKYYDGTALTFSDKYAVDKKPPDVNVSNISISSKSITDVGTVLSDEFNITSITVTDSTTGAVVNSANGWKIEEGAVVLEVKARKIEVTSISVEKDYSGGLLSDDTAWVSVGSLVSGHKIYVYVTGELSAFETSAVNTISDVTIYDSRGNDVTSNYSITLNEGTLRWLF